MSRAWRIEYEGDLYHLLSRGNQGSNIGTLAETEKRLKEVWEALNKLRQKSFAAVLGINVVR